MALANASLYLEAAGHVVVAWLWLSQLVTASDKSGTSTKGNAPQGDTSSTTNSQGLDAVRCAQQPRQDGSGRPARVVLASTPSVPSLSTAHNREVTP